MTRSQAISSVTSSDEVKIAHKYFSKDEWVKSKSIDGILWLEDECGYLLPFNEFFQIRKGGEWEDGWYIKKD